MTSYTTRSAHFGTIVHAIGAASELEIHEGMCTAGSVDRTETIGHKLSSAVHWMNRVATAPEYQRVRLGCSRAQGVRAPSVRESALVSPDAPTALTWAALEVNLGTAVYWRSHQHDGQSGVCGAAAVLAQY